MVKEQLLRRGISNKKVITAFLKVPRENFVPPELRGEAYEDCALPLEKGQTISQPYMVGLMTELLEIEREDRILEIGTGWGYQTAILAELGGEVFSIERLESLQKKAKQKLQELGYRNIYFRVGDGTLGWREKAPFNKIIVTAGAPSLPLPLIDQLLEKGKLVVPVGNSFSQTLKLFTKDEQGKVEEKSFGGCVFVPLIGKYGWEK